MMQPILRLLIAIALAMPGHAEDAEIAALFSDAGVGHHRHRDARWQALTQASLKAKVISESKYTDICDTSSHI